MEATVNRNDVLQDIYAALERVNALREPDKQLARCEETVLYGAEGVLDSLGLVSLIMDVEEGVNARYETQLVLADQRAMSQKRNPFRDVRSLADYVVERLKEGVHV
jgi:acyl carrier protein